MCAHNGGAIPGKEWNDANYLRAHDGTRSTNGGCLGKGPGQREREKMLGQDDRGGGGPAARAAEVNAGPAAFLLPRRASAMGRFLSQAHPNHHTNTRGGGTGGGERSRSTGRVSPGVHFSAKTNSATNTGCGWNTRRILPAGFASDGSAESCCCLASLTLSQTPHRLSGVNVSLIACASGIVCE